MKTLEIYANYGVLAHEKKVIYTYPESKSSAKYSEKITVEIPESVKCSENYYGEILLEVPGSHYTYLVRELLSSQLNKPALAWIDNQGRQHTAILKVI